MEVKVPRISERTIEAQAISLLERYEKEHEPIRKPPLPVDEIPEMVLKVRLEFDDLRKLLGRNDAIGATWFETSEIYIDQSPDPTEHPRKRGRYRFTVGHEIGHWVLHRRYVPDRASQLDLFEGRTPEPSILCRESSKREPAEWQADRFALFLLMPKTLVMESWRARDLRLLPGLLPALHRIYARRRPPRRPADALRLSGQAGTKGRPDGLLWRQRRSESLAFRFGHQGSEDSDSQLIGGQRMERKPISTSATLAICKHRPSEGAVLAV
ncbi:MAG: ImmA/IrrE family metallo-endopeptidase [Acidobacteria bacterium]|nr:ImmA/IrrE family metallo-endopeptidase [Acidobacteriota bacterium]